MALGNYEITLQKKKQLAPEVLLLTFSYPEHFSFKAGQYIMIEVSRDGEKKWRAYSILSPPSQKNDLLVCVKLIPGGLASEHFARAEVGEGFKIRGPLGHFVFDEQFLHLEQVFICTGTGVAPFYSMINEYLEKNPTISFTLLFGARTKKDLLFYEKFRLLEQKHPHFSYQPTLSREDWEGLQGRIQEHLHNGTNKIFYICGWKEMVLETKEKLEKLGVAKEHIRFERYN